MRLMKYSSPSCHSSRSLARSLAPCIIQSSEGGCSGGGGEGGGARIGVTVRGAAEVQAA